jgi:hypothetical protein
VTTDRAPSAPEKTPVLHVIVGHGLPTYFANAVRALRQVAPSDPLLVIDNASPGQELRQTLLRLAEEDDHIELVLRSENDLQANGKVGSLYSAYTLAFSRALDRGFELVHLVQADMQTLWWDEEVVRSTKELFGAHPSCVNVFTCLLSRDKQLTDDLAPSSTQGVLKLRKYGLTDTGLYHLARWQERGMRFGPSEQEHAKRYLNEGCEVLLHPLPVDAQVPWPAVIRGGQQEGKEVQTNKPYLLMPASKEQIRQARQAKGQVWLEDLCIPWGWSCLTPMWTTGLDSIDYLVLRYRAARRYGLLHGLPRIEHRGLDSTNPLAALSSFRPPLWRLLVGAPTREIRKRVRGAAARLSAT